LVGQMAAAVRNARLYEAVQAEAAARIQAEEERARLEVAEAAARAVAAEREHAARVLEAVGDGIFLVDEAGVVRFWNQEAEILTGLPRARVLETPIGAVFTIWPRIEQEVPIGEGEAVARQVTLPVDIGGRELWLAFVAVRSPKGVVYAFRDLTAEHRLDEAKSDFIAAVSHELRTPMTGVLGAAKTLLRQDVDFPAERRQELLEMIASQATRLSQVTEEVLLATSFDSGDLRIEKNAVDIPEVVRETVEAFKAQVPDSVSLKVRTKSRHAAIGDRDRIQQVLVNLLDNAVKYSPAGGSVVVSTRRLSDSVRVAVQDQGIGIPRAEQSRVFEKFYRGDPEATRRPGGTGLGLYICRELVERMGGRIGVHSEPDRGSTFFFDLLWGPPRADPPVPP
jgi:two-component system phosphate regulon sensor histidine kinase PhoR